MPDIRDDMPDMTFMGKNITRRSDKSMSSTQNILDFFKSLFTNNGDNNNSSAQSNAMKSNFTLNEDGSVDLNTLSSYGLDGLIDAVAGYFQASDPRINYAWSAQEAQKERDWQTEMSNTAYQRSVADMKSAGINPILAYSQGGATSGSGASASASPTNSGASLGSLMNGVSSIIKTLMSQDRLSDKDAMKAGQYSASKQNNHSSSNLYEQYKRNTEKFKH